MATNELGFWNLRLAAGKIADDRSRQLFLNAVAELIRRAPAGKWLMVADAGRPREPVWDDDPACSYDIKPGQRPPP
jgi:hypothetical protein